MQHCVAHVTWAMCLRAKYPRKDLNQTEMHQKIIETVQETVLAGFDTN